MMKVETSTMAPAGPGEDLEGHPRRRARDLPHEVGDGPPLPDEGPQDGAGEEDERAPLDGLGHQRRPPALEAAPGHHAVLDGEEGEDGGVDGEGDDERRLPAVVDG